MSAANKAIVEKVNQAFIDANIEGFLDHCNEDISWTMPGQGTWNGKETIRSSMSNMDPGNEFEKGMTNNVKSMIAEGDRVMCDGIVIMKKKSGGEYRGAYCDVYRFSDGKIAEMTSYVVDLKEKDQVNP